MSLSKSNKLPQALCTRSQMKETDCYIAKNIPTQLANILIFLKAGADRCSKGHNSSGYTLGLVNNNTSHHRESKIKRIGELYFCYSERKLSFLQIGLL